MMQEGNLDDKVLVTIYESKSALALLPSGEKR
jgi:hypothetical protein